MRVAARRGPSPPAAFCSFLATAADPSPNFGGGVGEGTGFLVQGRESARAPVLPLPRGAGAGGRGVGALARCRQPASLNERSPSRTGEASIERTRRGGDDQAPPISFAMMAFCTCSRFSASSQTRLRGPSSTPSVTSSPRCAGRHCRKMERSEAVSIISSLMQ